MLMRILYGTAKTLKLYHTKTVLLSVMTPYEGLLPMGINW